MLKSLLLETDLMPFLQWLRGVPLTATKWIEIAYLVIEILAVVIIVGSVFYSTVRYFYRMVAKKSSPGDNYREYKHSLGAFLILGLEILVAADVVRTVALEPTLMNVAALGLLVLVRIFLSWATVLEIEGRWPWQSKKLDPEVGKV